MNKLFGTSAAAVLLASFNGCSAEQEPIETGGAGGMNGVVATSGGSTGEAGGSANLSGGASAAGGAVVASGGAVASGGSANGSGGAPAAGGALVASGGAVVASGGAVTSGGTAAAGGAVAAGGMMAAGGTTGGASTGGAATGGAATGGPKKVMFIGATEGDENWEWDKYILPKLEAWGYPVDKAWTRTDLVNGITPEDYARYDFIFLSETMDTRIPGLEQLRDIPLPMVNSDGFAGRPERLAFVDDRDGFDSLKSVVFLPGAADHPLAGGHTPGTVVELGGTGEETCVSLWGRPETPHVAIAGIEDDPTMLMIYGIEKGTMNSLGGVMQHRVATLGIHCWCYDNLTAAGEKVYQAAIEWVLAE